MWSLFPRQLIYFHVFFLLFFTAAFSSASGPPDFTGKQIGYVFFKADGKVDHTYLRTLITTRPESAYSQSAVRQSVKNLFRLMLFSNIQVEARLRGELVYLTYHLTFEKFVRRIHVRGRPGLSRRERTNLSDQFRFVKFADPLVGDVKSRIGNLLRRKGYFSFSIQSEAELSHEDHFVTLTLFADHGPRATVSELKIEGSPPSLEESSRSVCECIAPGSSYSEKDLQKAKKRLLDFYQRLGFRLAKVDSKEVEYYQEDNTVHLALTVETGPKVIFSYEGKEGEKKKLLRKIPLKETGVFQDELMLEGEENIRRYFVQKGYRDVELDLSAREDVTRNLLYIKLDVTKNMPATIHSIEIKGITAFPEDDIRKRMATKTKRKFFLKGKFVESTLEKDIKAIEAFYLVRGYPEAEVQKEIINLPDGSVSIVLTVDEGTVTTIEEVRFRGNQFFSSEELSGRVSLKPGTRFTNLAFENNRNMIQAAYINEGFRQAAVRTRHEDQVVPDQEKRKTTVLTFHIEEGPQTFVDHVFIRGNFKTRRKVIERELKFHSGDPLSQGKILKSQQDIYRRRVFKRVRIFPENPDYIHNREDVVVEVEEGKPLTLNFGFGYDTDDRIRGLFGVTHGNLFGYNWTGNLSLKAGSRQQRAAVSLEHPYFFGKALDAVYSAFFENTKREGFNSRRIGVRLQLAKQIGSIRLISNYIYDDVVNYDMEIDEDDLNRYDRAVLISSVAETFVRDTRDNPLASTRGTMNSMFVQFAADFLGPGGGANFVKFFTQHTHYRPLTENTVLASSLRVGLSRAFSGETSLPISERFFAGGGATLRSLPLDMAGPKDDNGNPLGGNILLLVNIELRQSITSWSGIVFFYDTGNVFPDLNSVTWHEIRQCLGLGARLKTPVGPVRFDLGFNLDKREDESDYEIFISLGQTF